MSEAADKHEQELWDLENLALATGLGDWMFEQFAEHARGRAVEVGAGIGTFSRRLLDHGVRDLLLIEPDPACSLRLRDAFDRDPRVTVSQDLLPAAAALLEHAGTVDFVLCQNVLEHIAQERDAVGAMAHALAPGGVLSLLLPAHPRLFGRLDRIYGHERRYTRAHLRGVVEDAGLEVIDLYSFNALGILGWVGKSHFGEPSIDPRSLRAYERALRLYRPLERRLRLPIGLSLIVHARKPL